MDQSQGGNPFGRLIEFARPHKTGYIVSVVLAVLGVAFGIVPYFATARMTIELLSGNRDLSFYMVWCLISGGCFVLKAILMGISTRASHEATFEVLSEARRKIASKLTRVPMGYILNTPSGQLKNGMVERIEQLEVPLAHVIPEMTSNLLVPIAIIVYLFILDWRMALVSLITIPVGMMCYMGMMKEYPKKYGEVVKAGNHMSATTVEYIGGISFWLKPILALVPFFLLLSGSRKKVAIIYLIVFVVSWTVNIFLVSYMGLIGTIIISLLAQFGTRWFPSAMMGYYLLSTTKVSEFVLAMQRMHIPEAFIIPFSVMFRFFPTISEESGSIGNAMRMRGITGKNFFKNPQAVLEYRIVPLMMSVVTIGNDLSAAALTRGLGNGKKRTSICKIGFHWKDFALMIIVTAALLVFLLF